LADEEATLGRVVPGRDEDERLEMLGRPAVLRRAPDEIRVRVGREIEAAGARRAVARMAIDRLAARDPARHAEKALVDAGEFRLERRAGAYSLQALARRAEGIRSAIGVDAAVERPYRGTARRREKRGRGRRSGKGLRPGSPHATHHSRASKSRLPSMVILSSTLTSNNSGRSTWCASRLTGKLNLAWIPDPSGV